jgi:hypothetical protein
MGCLHDWVWGQQVRVEIPKMLPSIHILQLMINTFICNFKLL